MNFQNPDMIQQPVNGNRTEQINRLGNEARHAIQQAVSLARNNSQSLAPADVKIIGRYINEIVGLHEPKTKKETQQILRKTLNDLGTTPEQLNGLGVIAEDRNYEAQAAAYRALNAVLMISDPKHRQTGYKKWQLELAHSRRIAFMCAIAYQGSAGTPAPL